MDGALTSSSWSTWRARPSAPCSAGDGARPSKRVLHEAPRRLGDVNPQLSPFFEEVVHWLLAKGRQKRIQSAPELAQILEDGERSPWWRERAKAIRATTHRPL